jgi:hypothetical protein
MIGPIEQIPIGGGASADLYLLRFGDDGRLQSPQTARLAVDVACAASDVFLFSHGWNNIYADALARYRDFATGFVAQRAELALPVPSGYKPVLIGVIWPATWFVLPVEEGPGIAAGGSTGARDEEMLAEVTGAMSPEDAEGLTELLDGSRSLSLGEARRAAELVRGALWSEDDPDAASRPPDIPAVLSSWRALSEDETPFVDEDEPVGTIGTVGALANIEATVDSGSAHAGPGDERHDDASGPTAAGIFNFDPRDILRIGSVWRMKRRAGTVGTYGVGPILAELLQKETKARVHLVGHSFGARVVLSAVASQLLERKVHSMLLLQPAVNRWCFAKDVARTGRVGGYSDVLDRVALPIMTTFSTHDKPLHEFFHLAVRGDSLGEVNTAAVGDTERYGALGGYGPLGLGQLMLSDPMREPKHTYDLGGRVRVLAIDGSREINGVPAISGHGDVSNPLTWWALHCLVAGSPKGD